MKDQNIRPATPGTNKLKLRMRDSAQFQFAHMNLFGENYKKIQTGIGFGFATMCNKSFEVTPTSFTIKPSQGHVYLYFKCPVNGGKATLINSDVELFGTASDYLVLLKSSTYNELKY